MKKSTSNLVLKNKTNSFDNDFNKILTPITPEKGPKYLLESIFVTSRRKSSPMVSRTNEAIFVYKIMSKKGYEKINCKSTFYYLNYKDETFTQVGDN